MPKNEERCVTESSLFSLKKTGFSTEKDCFQSGISLHFCALSYVTALAQNAMHGVSLISFIFLQSTHQIDMKSVVKCWKDFLWYSNNLETYRDKNHRVWSTSSNFQLKKIQAATLHPFSGVDPCKMLQILVYQIKNCDWPCILESIQN